MICQRGGKNAQLGGTVADFFAASSCAIATAPGETSNYLAPFTAFQINWHTYDK